MIPLPPRERMRSMSADDLFSNASWTPEPLTCRPSRAHMVTRMALNTLVFSLPIAGGAFAVAVILIGLRPVLAWKSLLVCIGLVAVMGGGTLGMGLGLLSRGYDTSTVDCDLYDSGQRTVARTVLRHATPDSLFTLDANMAWKQIEFGTGFTPTRKPGPWTRAMKDHDGWISIRITHVTPVPPSSSHLFRVDFLATWHATIDGCEQVAEDPREHTWIINSARPVDVRIDAP